MRWTSRRTGLVLGPALFAAALLLPAGDLPWAARATAASVLWMAVWWTSEAVPIGGTSLLPLVLFPLLGVASSKEAAAPYAHPLVFLLMGGFFLAKAIERWDLHRRIALSVVVRVGTSPSRVILGFMLASAFLSLWISNTATTIMMMPIAAAVIREVEGAEPGDETPFAVALLLGVAYASSIGGMGTLIGTAPNLVFKGVVNEHLPGAPPVEFFDWMRAALPFVIFFLPITWLYLTRVATPLRRSASLAESSAVRRALDALGPLRRPERRTLLLFGVTVLLWITRARIDLGFASVPGWSDLLGLAGKVDDATVAVGMAIVFFVWPSGAEDPGAGRRILDWESASRIPWGLLLLIGGGFSMAAAVQTSGLGAWLADRAAALAGAPTGVWAALVTTLVTFLTEVTSNTAITSTLLPILARAAEGAGAPAILVLFAATLAASCAFMLPVATPPNAIVYGTGYLRISTMVRVGLWLNFLAIAGITLLTLTVGRGVFG